MKKCPICSSVGWRSLRYHAVRVFRSDGQRVAEHKGMLLSSLGNTPFDQGFVKFLR